MVPHVNVHRRSHYDRRGSREIERRKKVAGNALREVRQNVCGRRNNQQCVNRLCYGDVLDGGIDVGCMFLAGREHPRNHFVARKRCEGERPNKLLGGARHDNLHANPAVLQEAYNLRRLVGRDASRHSKSNFHDLFSGPALMRLQKLYPGLPRPAPLRCEFPGSPTSLFLRGFRPAQCGTVCVSWFEPPAELRLAVGVRAGRRPVYSDSCCQSLRSISWILSPCYRDARLWLPKVDCPKNHCPENGALRSFARDAKDLLPYFPTKLNLTGVTSLRIWLPRTNLARNRRNPERGQNRLQAAAHIGQAAMVRQSHDFGVFFGWGLP